MKIMWKIFNLNGLESIPHSIYCRSYKTFPVDKNMHFTTEILFVALQSLLQT